MPETRASLTDCEDNDDYAALAAQRVIDDPQAMFWAIGGTDDDGERTLEYAIEPDRGGCARALTDELYNAIEDLPDYRDGAAIIVREVRYGPWRYVTPDEIRRGDAL
ncbi:hypothetical protein [Mycobacterium sp. PSTR-4-N]|uniref:hypothetical protein n=1 Tax=Mycobacterium sp. PSTR-4-N TaxID=2917745 RepID=UPI001F155783|nr:hypothetical protein [Mycobacterium sp. PSTR-4-N]MCG7596328.1 hypothetical protein [Mycobacterium sp. PSTR-4-N]